MSTILSAFSQTSSSWRDYLKNQKVSHHILPFILNSIYKDESIWGKHISKDLHERIKSDFDLELPKISSVKISNDETTKFLIQFKDQMEVETVLIPFFKRNTICLSTQVGCAMNCSFCYTGTQGLKRNLTSGEIVGQYLVARNWQLSKHPKAPPPSIVFMGQGEPLHNVDEVLQAIKVLNDPNLIGIGHRQMTLSTVGHLPGLKRISEFPSINFALSLHSPFNHERSLLIPVNMRYPLEEILKEIDQIKLLPRQFINFEYLMIKNFNMTDDHVDGLEVILKNRPAILNLIPFNPYPGTKWERPDTQQIDAFKTKLVDKKIRVMIRRTKGDDILGACGQLKVQKLMRNHHG